MKVCLSFLFISLLFTGTFVFANTVSENLSTQKEIIPIGEKPERSEEIFLRKETILLKKGKSEIKIDFNYLEKALRNLLVEEINGKPVITDQKNTIRSLMMTLVLRYGVTNNLLAYVITPFRCNYNEIPTGRRTKNYRNTGLGDVRGGINYQIINESFHKPDLIFTLETKAQTGESPYDTSPNKTPLGTGHWNTSVGLKAIRTIDPVVLFSGFGYTHVFRRKVKEDKINPGGFINFELGTGFALNDEIVIIFRSIGFYIFYFYKHSLMSWNLSFFFSLFNT